jgi:heat shock protein HslJ
MYASSLVQAALGSLLLLGVTNACTSDKDGAENNLALTDRTFLLDEAEGFEPVAGSVVRLSFSEQDVSFSAGCNGFSGPYALEGASLVVSGMGGTDMGCSNELQTQDEWLVHFFTSTPSIGLEGDTLTVASQDASLVFLDRVVADPDRSLTGQAWTVDTLLSGDAASTIPGNLPQPVLTLGDDGSLALSTPCNEATGTYAATADVLRFSDVNFTRSTCSDSAGTELVAHLTSVFADGTATYGIEAARLTIERDDSAVGIGAVAVSAGGS